MQLPSVMDSLSPYLSEAATLAENLDFSDTMLFLLVFAGCSLVLTVVGRLILGKHSSLNHCVSCAMGILFLYAVSIVLYSLNPWNIPESLNPLPFLIFAGEHILMISFQHSAFSVICHELLSLLILAFLMNLLDTFVPKGKSIVTWFFLRFLTAAAAMALHVLADWAFDTYLPHVLVTYAPVILLGVLLGTMLLGVVNFLLGVFLAVVDPILGAIYTFFFANIVGKQLTKAVITCLIICAVIFLLGQSGPTLILVSEQALVSYIPFGIVMLILWYIIGHLL